MGVRACVLLCVCMRARALACARVRARVLACVVFVCLRTWVRVCVCMFAHACVPACLRLWACARMCKYVCARVHLGPDLSPRAGHSCKTRVRHILLYIYIYRYYCIYIVYIYIYICRHARAIPAKRKGGVRHSTVVATLRQSFFRMQAARITTRSGDTSMASRSMSRLHHMIYI